MATLPPAKIRGASGIINLIRNIGGAIGFAAINSMMDQRYAAHMNSMAAGLTAGKIDNLLRPHMALPGSDNLALWQGLGNQSLVRKAVQDIAMSHALNDLLKLIAVAAFIVALSVMFLKRAKRAH
jgi:DHA2 family multidrug resistance protein